jgi:hypothetical protein
VSVLSDSRSLPICFNHRVRFWVSSPKYCIQRKACKVLIKLYLPGAQEGSDLPIIRGPDFQITCLVIHACDTRGLRPHVLQANPILAALSTGICRVLPRPSPCEQASEGEAPAMSWYWNEIGDMHSARSTRSPSVESGWGSPDAALFAVAGSRIGRLSRPWAVVGRFLYLLNLLIAVATRGNHVPRGVCQRATRNLRLSQIRQTTGTPAHGTDERRMMDQSPR